MIKIIYGTTWAKYDFMKSIILKTLKIKMGIQCSKRKERQPEQVIITKTPNT
jgi:hypothetical protein